MGSSKSVTVGYHYYLGLHFGLCHGPVDEVQKVVIGERDAWIGEQSTSGAITINQPELFGGDKREGGVVGTLDVLMGESTQVENTYLQAKIGALIPAFRGILSAVWRGGKVTANNPYLKPWAFRVKRILQGWSTGSAWYPEKAPIVFQAPTGNDPSVRLLTRFEGASSADISQYQIGSGTIISPDGVLIADGYARFGVTAIPPESSPYTSGLIWEDSALTSGSVTNPEMTWEFILSAEALDSQFDNYTGIVQIYSGQPSGDVRLSINAGTVGTGSVGRLDFVSYYTTPVTWQSPNSFLKNDGMGTFHVAVQKRANGDVQLYVNGSRVADFGDVTGFPGTNAVGVGSTRIFCYGHREDLDIRCYAVRVSSRLVYSGTTYTVPTPEELTADFGFIDSGLVGMNPAHIIYQCLTDTNWGMGYPTTAVDSTSFTAAANALYAENFGLSMLWNQQETIENFIGVVLDHIGGILYVDPASGKFALKLIRDDYVRESLPQYGPTNLIAAEGYQRQAWGETINEISVVHTHPYSGKEVAVTVQDLANINMQGGVVSQTRSYSGIPWPPLAQRVALRDLQSSSTPLARIELRATRAAWAVFPGDVFRLSWPEYGIEDVVYRALEVNRGTLQNGAIIIKAVEDVFGLPDNTYLVDQPSEWVNPSNQPAAAPYRKMIEAPYWDLARNLSHADLDYVDSLSGYLETVAVRPSGDATNYRIYARVGAADYTEGGNGDFCPSATVVEALTKTTTAITLANAVDLDIFEVGGYAVIDSEYVLVSALDAIALTATISRGVLDTVPVAHSAGARIWFADSYTGFSTTEYVDGEVVDVKLLPITGQGELSISLAPVDTLTLDQRQYRPYPPGKVRFDTLEWPATIEGSTDVVLTWAHRDRLAQTAYIVEQDEASIGPEASVTYSVEVTDEALAVLYSATGITAATATVPGTSLTGGLLRFRLWSVRGGLASYQIHEHWVVWGGEIRLTEDGYTRITESGETRVTD